jgi:hypothetical protein
MCTILYTVLVLLRPVGCTFVHNVGDNYFALNIEWWGEMGQEQDSKNLSLCL